jgi:uncharacterized protein
MLKFVPFVERAGMQYIGDTEGNLRRLGKDLRYLLDNRERIQSGEVLKERTAILDLQVRYAEIVYQMLCRSTQTLDGFMASIPKHAGELPPEDYQALRALTRLPKPNYILGLSDESRAFVNRRLRELGIHKTLALPRRSQPKRGRITIQDLTCEVRAPSPTSPAALEVVKAFGLEDLSTQRILGRIGSIVIEPGSIALICGPSGSGKTTLLRAILAASEDRRPSCIDGSVEVDGYAVDSSILDQEEEAPILEMLIRRGSLESSLRALNAAGLSEPTLYLRRPSELSAGQRYRAHLAYLIQSSAAIWLCDEFCSNLDSLTAAVVARNSQKRPETPARPLWSRAQGSTPWPGA